MGQRPETSGAFVVAAVLAAFAAAVRPSGMVQCDLNAVRILVTLDGPPSRSMMATPTIVRPLTNADEEAAAQLKLLSAVSDDRLDELLEVLGVGVGAYTMLVEELLDHRLVIDRALESMPFEKGQQLSGQHDARVHAIAKFIASHLQALSSLSGRALETELATVGRGVCAIADLFLETNHGELQGCDPVELAKILRMDASGGADAVAERLRTAGFFPSDASEVSVADPLLERLRDFEISADCAKPGERSNFHGPSR